MPVAATGPISLLLANLRTLIANCASFQSWTSSADATAAATRIHLVDLPAPTDGKTFTAEHLATLRPLAIVDLFEMDGRPGLKSFEAQRLADLTFQNMGKLILAVEADVPTEFLDSPGDAKLDFLNKVGAVVEDIYSLSGVSDYLTVRHIEIFIPVTRSDQSQNFGQGDFFRTQLLIDHGI